MKRTGFAVILLTICAISLITGILCSKQLSSDKAATVKNLQTTYDLQMNVKKEYLEYSKKAEQEGYLKAAQLFRAMSDSVMIRARSTSKVLTDLGVTPASTSKKVTVRSTRENLESAIKSEQYKIDKIYSKFTMQAEQDKVKSAVMAFGGSSKVGSNGTALLQDALKNLTSWKMAGKGFYVCQICGNPVATIDFTDCPVCDYPASEYKRIV